MYHQLNQKYLREQRKQELAIMADLIVEELDSVIKAYVTSQTKIDVLSPRTINRSVIINEEERAKQLSAKAQQLITDIQTILTILETK